MSLILLIGILRVLVFKSIQDFFYNYIINVNGNVFFVQSINNMF